MERVVAGSSETIVAMQLSCKSGEGQCANSTIANCGRCCIGWVIMIIGRSAAATVVREIGMKYVRTARVGIPVILCVFAFPAGLEAKLAFVHCS